MASASGGGDTQDGCGGVIIGSVPRAGGAYAQDGVSYRKAVQDGRPNGGDGYREEAVLRQQRPVHMDQRKPQQQGPQLPPRPIELEAVELSEKALRIIHANTEEANALLVATCACGRFDGVKTRRPCVERSGAPCLIYFPA
eukprot:2996305-Pleurochrysis_carterae.AAC.1